MAIEGINSLATGATMSASVNMARQAQVSVNTADVKDSSTQSTKQSVMTDQTTAGNRGNQQNTTVSEDGKEQDLQLNEKTLKQRISDINHKLNNNTIAEFGYHDGTNRVTIKIVDKDTKETIKEIPPEKTLDLIAKAWELAGILVDEKR